MGRTLPVICVAIWCSASLAGEQLPIHHLSAAARQQRLESDVKAVRIYRNGLRAAVGFVASRPDLFPPAKLEKARLLRREEKEAVWSAWKSFLDYVVALDAIGRYHRNFYRLDGSARAQSLLVARSALAARYRYAMEFIERADKDPGFNILLNEPVPEIGLAHGVYAWLKQRFLNLGRAGEFAALEAAAKYFGVGHDAEVEDDASFVWRAAGGRGPLLSARNALEIARQAGFSAWFPVQAGASEWMGDTKVHRRGNSLVSQEQIRTVTPRLEPGDILLERREWYLSNIGLPGFWPHAALFIGTPAERQPYFEDAEVRDWVRAQGHPDGDLESLLRARYPAAYATSLKSQEGGHVPRVIEAISEGVSFTTMEHSADADSVAVLRPRLSRREKAVALVRAFAYAGRPYDFNFDFLTDSSLVCTELISKAYEPSADLRGLRFPLVEILGRMATPANEIVRQFDSEHGTTAQQTDLLLFLDGYERGRRAVEAGLQAFRQSWRRPKWHIVTQKLPQ